MNRAILLYATTDKINMVVGWILGLITGGLILRATNDLINVYFDPDVDMTFKEALKKIKKRIYAVLIAITIDSLVVFFVSFY